MTSPAFDPSAVPSGAGCVECLEGGGWWFHLRRCAGRGHIGCCDTSPGQPATAHAKASRHDVIATFEPGEDWFHSYAADGMVDGPELAAPTSHPADQPAPGPAGSVPTDWMSRLN